MILRKIILLLYIFIPFVDVKIYLYNTVDSPSVDLYDCILHESLFYCRHPKEPIDLHRSNDTLECFNNGIPHSFADLRKQNVSIGIILHEWKSSLEKVEEYIRYMKNSSELDGYLCQCTNPQSFGKNCEYLLPTGTTFAQTVEAENSLKNNNSFYVQLYGDVICYITLDCQSSLLGLDWRDICDGVQQCMYGVDEDNCDKLEYSECEEDEYRCMNGMCIPDEYFLDGEYDCLDWSEELQYYDNSNCPIEVASAQCDDRICSPNEFSCGDGQCISDQFDFQIMSQIKSECWSRREQYFLCETHYIKDMWTLPNGRCFEGVGYNQSNASRRTADEECEFLLLCDLSDGVEVHCPCGNNSLCTQELNTTCRSKYIPFPKEGVMAPYIFFFYSKYYQLRPDHILINGTIKCDGLLTNITGMTSKFFSKLRQVEETACRWAKNQSVLKEYNVVQQCHQHSVTFNNHSYSLSNICNESKKCISTHRIKDGFDNCVDKADEVTNLSSSTVCSNVQRHRFRCSADQPTCLSVTTLGNLQDNCENKFDELWLGTSTKLADINCNKFRKDQCSILRQYIEISWRLSNTNQLTKQLQIPFRHYCNTFWNLASNEDENIDECREWWVCSDDQWQCDTGQCIDERWVLDGEWDCADASDEDNQLEWLITDRNLQVVPLPILMNRSTEQSKSAPFSTVCNLTTEFPCFPVNVVYSSTNFTKNPPCISKSRIGNGHIDCFGAIDERNKLAQCNQPTMLGYNYKCSTIDRCIPYWNYCLGDRCDRTSDDLFWCDERENAYLCGRHSDAVCFNGTCMQNGRCDRILDCEYGEDEYMCEYRNIEKLTGELYRQDKELMSKNTEQKLRLFRFPANARVTVPWLKPIFITPPTTAPTNNTYIPIAYWCNRGVGIQLYNDSIVCFCPPQYYGDKCQFHSDRITLVTHLNFTQSIYTIDTDINIVLKIVVLFLFDNEVIANNLFHVRVASEFSIYSKKVVHFLYSRSVRFLQHKQQRYFNQSNIINEHPYSIRFEIYEGKSYEEPIFIGLWQYPIYFDYLPVYRFSKVLRLTKPNNKQNPCSNNPCNHNQTCHQLINEPSKYICLCKSNYSGENCSIEDQQCIDGYCSYGSICRPNYRGVLMGNHLPYCICRFDYFGERCNIKHDLCTSNPCLHNGTCHPTSKPDAVSCKCTEQFYGKHCEESKSKIRLYIKHNISHTAAVVQYFDIEVVSLNLILVHQQLYQALPSLIEYRHQKETAPAIILIKLYPSVQINIPPKLYLISLHIDVTGIYGTTQLTNDNQCIDINELLSTNQTQIITNLSPIHYHQLCQNYSYVMCFRDEFYLCICNENHTRVECFLYDSTLDQCSYCLSGGRCLKGDQYRAKDYICLCPRCYTGSKCQFNSNSFTFTLDQLFYTDLISTTYKTIFRLLIILPIVLFLIALPNNLLSIITFRRQKCSVNGVGHYLFYISIINQLSLGMLVARLIHLNLTITGIQSHRMIDNILCKVLNYLLICFTRIAYWLVSFVATERVYTTVFLKGQWLKKPYVARRLIALTCIIVFSSTIYELLFVQSFIFDDSSNGTMCVIMFPTTSQYLWILIHQIISILHSMLPLLLNLGCTITMIYIIIKSKMNLHKTNKDTKITDTMGDELPNTLEEQENDHIEKIKSNNENLKSHKARYRFNVLRNVITDNKEILTRPAITLIPSIFSLFSVPLLISSLSLGCQDIAVSPMRYAFIVFYFISFVPQIITFFVYVYPSSLYFNEWRLTTIGQWITSFTQSSSIQNTIALSTINEERLKNISGFKLN